jgi:hypothetical protein
MPEEAMEQIDNTKEELQNHMKASLLSELGADESSTSGLDEMIENITDTALKDIEQNISDEILDNIQNTSEQEVLNQFGNSVPKGQEPAISDNQNPQETPNDILSPEEQQEISDKKPEVSSTPEDTPPQTDEQPENTEEPEAPNEAYDPFSEEDPTGRTIKRKSADSYINANSDNEKNQYQPFNQPEASELQQGETQQQPKDTNQNKQDQNTQQQNTKKQREVNKKLRPLQRKRQKIIKKRQELEKKIKKLKRKLLILMTIYIARVIFSIIIIILTIILILFIIGLAIAPYTIPFGISQFMAAQTTLIQMGMIKLEIAELKLLKKPSDILLQEIKSQMANIQKAANQKN